MADGWVSVHRELNDHWLWKDKPFAKGQAWVDILIRVNHKEASVPVGNQVVELNKGETLWSVLDMAKKWGWSRTKVENFLKLLENEQQISTKKTTKYTIVTVLKWDSYQNNEKEKTTKEQQKDNNKASIKQQESTNNNDNKNNNENNDNKKPKELKIFLPDSIEYRASEYLWGKILSNNPEAKKPNIQLWCKEFDFMIRLDKRTQSDIGKVIDYCQNDNFWKTVVLSPKKLRDKFDALTIKMKSQSVQQHKKGSVEELKEFANGDVVREFLERTGGVK